MEDMDLDLDGYEYDEYGEEEEGGGDERQNRTFIILVAMMGGVLLLGIIAFCVWVVFFANPNNGGTAQVVPTDTPEITTPIDETPVDETTVTAAVPTGGAETSEPSPEVTETQGVTPTRTPRPTTTPAAVGEVSPTPPEADGDVVTSPTPSRTPRPDSSPDDLPADTGFGAFTAVVLAAGLFFLLFMARRLRAAH